MFFTFSDSIGSTPAKVNRETGEIFLNSNVWNDLPQPYQAFIIAHEIGHFQRQTTNELEADHYAFEQIAGTFPESLKNTVRVLYGVLPYTNPTHGLRLLNMYRLALCYDYQQQPTAERLQEIKAVENDILKNYSNNPEFMIYSKQSSGSELKYEFPGYNQKGFDPSVGRWFRDFPISAPKTSVPWPDPLTDSTTDNSSNTTTAVPVAETVSLDFIPDFNGETLTLDLRTVIICFLVVVAISILNKL